MFKVIYKRKIFIFLILIFFIIIFNIGIFAQQEGNNNQNDQPNPDYMVEPIEDENITLTNLFFGLQQLPVEQFKEIIEFSNNHELLKSIVNILAENKSEEAIDLLIMILKMGTRSVKTVNNRVLNNFWDIKVEACIALGKMKAEKAIEPLIDLMINDKDPFVKAYAAKALGEIGAKEAVPFIIRILNVYKEAYRTSYAPAIYHMVVALGKIGDKNAIPILLEVAEGKVPLFIRKTAMISIRKILKGQ